MPAAVWKPALESSLDHRRVPLWENIEAFRRQLRAPFYCPGHKGGRTLPKELGESFGVVDLNNLPDTDTLHCPTGSIHEAQTLLADAYGVDRSFMLVGGSSLGNMAAVMSVAGPGDVVLAQRNAHKSVIAGIIHSGAMPQWMLPDWDTCFGIAHGVSVATIQQRIAENSSAKAALVLNPTYYGVVPDIAAIVDACHQAGLILIADEAHGPHFHFGDSYPLAAEDAGADIVVQSTHKILSGLSQAAVLHLKGQRVDRSSIQSVLQSLQTTSPNFAILASIDLARRQMMEEGDWRLKSLRGLAIQTREAINDIPGLRTMDQVHATGAGTGFLDLDPTKLLIDVSAIGWSGGAALQFLNREFGVQPELSGPGYLLCIMTVGSSQEDVDQLLKALRALSCQPAQIEHNLQGLNTLAKSLVRSIPTAEMSPRDAFYAPLETIPFSQSLHRISGEIITPYPPGIPVIMPGERFDRSTMELLNAVKESHCPISAVDPFFDTVRVLK